ncbi:MAG: thioredoxin domain-containing protein [Bacillota bacterium]
MIQTKTPNHLIHEKSPYLLQHAHNPVNWYPWGDEAFNKAKAEDKPVFLSIGYSTCHWCHVMAHESFEDEEVARLMNRDFVAVKVDREERPDIDAVYMTVCQALTGQGGWPLTIIMTPEQKPFFAGTYFPRQQRYSMPGVMEILQSVAEQWKTNKPGLIESGDSITQAIQSAPDKKGGTLSKKAVEDAFSMFASAFDEAYGGFGRAPKFPAPHQLMFLLRYHHVHKNKRALAMVEKTLEQMYKGGLFDHIGFGFSRYSTDNKWLVPHFEKMLYDNALLTMVYLEAYQITKKELYRTVAEKTLEYVLRELTDEQGGFYSAQDADSEGVEGKYYVLGRQEILNLLGEEYGSYFCAHFGITDKGNFEGKSIPNLIENRDFDKPDERIERLRKTVFAYRAKRTVLHKDDKILTAWTSLMTVAFAKAYRILGKPEYLAAAKKAVGFIETKLTDNNQRLFVRYRDGEAAHRGNVDDYAFYVWALCEMYASTFDAAYLKKALRFNQAAIDFFWDNENGGFFLYGQESERLIHRPKERYDGAMPSGNSVAAYNLVWLSKLTADPGLEELAQRQLETYIDDTKNYPIGFSFYLMALMPALYDSREIVCVVRDADDLAEIQKWMRENFMPDTAVLVKNGEGDPISEVAGFIKEYGLKNGRTTFYVCKGNACAEPFNGMDELRKRA